MYILFLPTQEDFLKEIDMTRHVNHQHLVQFFGCVVDDWPCLLIMEHVLYGDAKNLLRKLTRAGVCKFSSCI